MYGGLTRIESFSDLSSRSLAITGLLFHAVSGAMSTAQVIKL